MQTSNINKIRNILRGNNTSETRTKAISMLSEIRFPHKEKELGSFLLNSNEMDSVRHVAARSLGLIDSSIARRKLIKSTKLAKGNLLATVVNAMAMYGDIDSLQAISKIKKESSGFVKSQAIFAAAIISHRLGLRGNALPPPNQKGYLKISNNSKGFAVQKASRDEVDKCLKSIGEKPFGLSLTQEHAYEFDHGGNSIFLLNAEFASYQSLNLLRIRKAIPALIAQKNEESKSYFLSYLILTSPKTKGNDIHIWLARSHGKISFGGTATLVAGTMNFKVRSISERGVFPMVVEGIIAENGFSLSTAKYSLSLPIRTRLT